MTVRSSVSILVLASAGLFVASAAAHADWCVDLRSGQNYDCAKDPPSGKTSSPPVKAPSELRENIRRGLAAKAAAGAAQDPQQFVERITAAQGRAHNALKSAQMSGDPQDRQQAQRNYDAAMRDLGKAYDDAAVASGPDGGKAIMASKQAMMNAMAQEATTAGVTTPADINVTAPATAQPTVNTPAVAAVQPTVNTTAPNVGGPTVNTAPPRIFSVCEPAEKGVTTCYEIGKAGSACQKVFYQGGELTWRDPQMSTCNAGDLAQRNAFYAGRPVGGDPANAPAIDPRSQQLAGLMSSVSPQCQADLKSYLYGARDSKGSSNAQTTAMRSFVGINRDPECKAALDRLASTVGVEIPPRRLASKSRSTWDSAMADRPRAEINVPTGEYMANGYYSDGSAGGSGWNTGEVLDAGIQILGVLGGILGAASGAYGGGGYVPTPTYTSRPTTSYGGPSGSGYVYRGGSSGGSNSTITGTRR